MDKTGNSVKLFMLVVLRSALLLLAGPFCFQPVPPMGNWRYRFTIVENIFFRYFGILCKMTIFDQQNKRT